MTKTVRLFLSILLMALSQLAIANKDYVIERAYFEDVTGQLSFEDAKNKDYQPIEYILAKGYSSSVFWVRLKIQGSPIVETSLKNKYGDVLVLRVQPPYLDEVRLYDPLSSVTGDKVIGDKHSLDNNDFSSLNFNLAIPRSNESRYVWLRVKSTSTIFMRAQVLSYEDFRELDRSQEFGFSFYLAILVFLFLFPLLIWIKNKDYLTGVFVLKQLGAISLLIFNAGYLRFVLKDIDLEVVQFIVNVNLLAYSLITMFFHYVFLNEYVMKKWAKMFLVIAMIAFPIEFIFLIAQFERLALNVNMVVLNLITFSFLVIPAYGIDWKKSSQKVFSKNWLILIHILIFGVGISTTLPSLGYFQGNQFSAFSALAYGGITGIIFFIVLQYRYRVAREESIAKVSSAEAYAEAERDRREQQAQFLAMLTHELKTPLSIMKMGYTSSTQSDLTKKHIQTAIQDMADVIDRCVMDDKLQNHEFQLKIQKCNLNELIEEKINQYQDSSRVVFSAQAIYLIETDVQLLKIVIGNLVDNALKYAEDQSLIEIRLSKSTTSNQVELMIENQVGKNGFPDIGKIFDKYYRSPKAYEKTGSGLGLYLVKNFVQLISGEITCITRDQSIGFKVNLPLKTQ